jgi:CID domain
MSKPKWVGEHELSSALADFLRGGTPAPKQKVKDATTAVLKHADEYKMVVFDVERWMKKCSVHDRISGILLIDSVCRASVAAKKSKGPAAQIAPRFATRIHEIMALLQGGAGVEDSSFVLLCKVLDSWQRSSLFPGEKSIGAVLSSQRANDLYHARQQQQQQQVGGEERLRNNHEANAPAHIGGDDEYGDEDGDGPVGLLSSSHDNFGALFGGLSSLDGIGDDEEDEEVPSIPMPAPVAPKPHATDPRLKVVRASSTSSTGSHNMSALGAAENKIERREPKVR